MPTLEVIQEKLRKLQAQANVLIAKKAQSALDQIRGLMLEHGLTTEDIEARAKANREAKAASSATIGTKRKSSSALGTKVAPKYQDPKSGATWSGRGSAPAWIAKAKDRAKFLIQSNAVAADATGAPEAKSSSVVSTAVRRGHRTGPQPAKDRDRKSGATWSGKGRAPAWLANAKDRTKFLIDGEGAAADAGTVTKISRNTPAAAKKASATKNVVKKVAAGKVIAKKAAAVKKVAKKAAPAKSATASKKAVAKNSGPVARKRVAKKGIGSSDAAKKSTASDAGSDTGAAGTPAV
jgi:DNA-binding protein H-NS